MKCQLLPADSIVVSSGKGMLWSLSPGRRVLMRACCGGMNFLNRANGFEPLSRCAVAAVILTTLGSSKSVECAIGRAKSPSVYRLEENRFAEVRISSFREADYAG